MVEKIKNIYLVNAPAGSGKTTYIKEMIQHSLIEQPNDNILCITFTNRAADEISRDIITSKVFVGTIHSFINSFISRYFSNDRIINLYFKIYGDAINARINNVNQDKNISLSNEKYIEKYGNLDYDTVKKNIKKLSYNESPFNSLYNGGLSHKDLIIFTKIIVDKFPIIQKRISAKYQVIFIDEYQDTSANVLNLFFDAVLDTNTKLYLLGDKMQQIYDNYDGSFEDKFEFFDRELSLKTNYRSVKSILDILNKIYNDPNYIQSPSEKMIKIEADIKPQIIICTDINSKINELHKKYSNLLVLYLLNQERFDAIGSGNLHRAFSKTKKYSFGKSFTAVDILTKDYPDNPDSLMKLIFIISEMFMWYKLSKYGLIISGLKSNKGIFNSNVFKINNHEGKLELSKKLESIFSVYESNKSIKKLLEVLIAEHLVFHEYIHGIIEDPDYEIILNISISEVRALVNYLNDPKISTQHGVKGESHETVAFIADNSSSTPITHMYKFFEFWSKIDISLTTFQDFYYKYLKFILETQKMIGCKISELKKDTYSNVEEVLKNKATEICNFFSDNSIFSELCKEDYINYLEKPGVTKAKECFKDSNIYGILSAYKLFYVGCSRARKNLVVILDEKKIVGDLKNIKKKFIDIGFEVN